LDLKGDLFHLQLRDVQMNVRALAAGVRDGLALAAFASGAAGLRSVGRVVPHDSPSGPPLPGLDQRKRQSGIRRGFPPSPWAPRPPPPPGPRAALRPRPPAAPPSCPRAALLPPPRAARPSRPWTSPAPPSGPPRGS